MLYELIISIVTTILGLLKVKDEAEVLCEKNISTITREPGVGPTTNLILYLSLSF